MFVLLDAISLAGDRAAQNDDAWGITSAAGGDRAFVLDGATDLADAPLMPAASDAAWIARFAASRLAASGGEPDLRGLLRRVMAEARAAFEAGLAGAPWPPRWRLPTAAVLTATELATGEIEIADLGDCRAFALGADGVAQAFGGNPRFKDDEGQSAARLAQAPTGGNARYRSAEALALLRAQREAQGSGYFVLGVEPHAADHVRIKRLTLSRPAHLLLCTDGFSALVDSYGAYDAEGLVRAAIERGLAALGEELRAIERADADGAKHARWKRSDDATAILLRA